MRLYPLLLYHPQQTKNQPAKPLFMAPAKSGMPTAGQTALRAVSAGEACWPRLRRGGLRPALPSAITSPFALPRILSPFPMEGFLERKPTSIADKIAGTTPPCLSQKPSNIIANNLRFSREPLFERGSPPPSLRRGLFFWWTTPPLMRYTGDGNLPQFSITQPHLSQKPPAAVANQ